MLTKAIDNSVQCRSTGLYDNTGFVIGIDDMDSVRLGKTVSRCTFAATNAASETNNEGQCWVCFCHSRSAKQLHRCFHLGGQILVLFFLVGFQTQFGKGRNLAPVHAGQRVVAA
ncbi:hypothetical protein SAMN05216210_0629 [Halopseudomonas salegens]|uniref:Uncharacterized protein n=1 Tax=Halopseudomonas salegens TaxID=1434072 RepID=A0A1H2EEG6_9GAMM|nr:hypothetical protein SAMN05216210_0629 [Halopseudomonas salegens]